MFAMIGEEPLFPRYVLGISLGFGIYIMGITTMARNEATGGRNLNLLTGFIVLIVGLGLIAIAPQITSGRGWNIRPDRDFPFLIGLISIPIVLRGLRVQVAPSPENIQNAIRAGILSIIPLAAGVAYLGAGAKWGLAVFALAGPAVFLAARLRVT